MFVERFKCLTCRVAFAGATLLVVAACSNNDVGGVDDPFGDLPRRDIGTVDTATADSGPSVTPFGPEDVVCEQECAALDGPCVRGACGADGECFVVDLVDGSSCDDGDLCTRQDVCVAGECVATPTQCEPGSCATATCDPDTGECVDAMLPDDTPCALESMCVVGACRAGTCVESGPVDCSGASTDQCSVAICDPAIGCVTATRANATCDDGDGCTIQDRCDEQGECVGEALDCAAQAGPCQVGVCDASAGACVFTDVLDGTTCDDGSACTKDDACAMGVCEGALVDCGADTCNTASCDPVTGCALTPLVGATCDDGDGCTGPDQCDMSGVCVGVTLQNPPVGCP